MKSLHPLWQLWRPRIARLHRLYLSTLSPHAPSDLHLRGLPRLANLERR